MGRPRSSGKQMEYAIELYKSKAMSIRNICEATGVSKATLMRRIKEMKEQLEQLIS